MDARLRRERILAELQSSGHALTGAQLAAQFGVARQIIVQDIAILRAAGHAILATPQGYLVTRLPQPHGIVAVRHRREDIEEELCAIVDEGATVVDVMVEHALYGEIRGLVMCRSRRDVADFCARLAETGAEPLLVLTGGVHLHTLSAPDEAVLERAKAALRRKGFLLEDGALGR